MHSKPANLAGWALATAPAGGGVADEELYRGRDRRNRERDDEAEAVVAVAPAAEHADRVDGGDQEAGDHVRRQPHVEELVAGRRVEEHLERPDVGDVARRVEVEALRLVHPGV